MLIPITQTEELKTHGIHMAYGTLKNWKHKGRYPGMFVKEFDRIYIDTDHACL